MESAVARRYRQEMQEIRRSAVLSAGGAGIRGSAALSAGGAGNPPERGVIGRRCRISAGARRYQQEMQEIRVSAVLSAEGAGNRLERVVIGSRRRISAEAHRYRQEMQDIRRRQIGAQMNYHAQSSDAT
ncbi:hypothetical protein ACFOGI_13405 [Virgibacillus xinjiangensis]|uniref:Uncharacterized protein n=1 Tax=Virgibacillus xinjiangensis TaxID=393090 RepID=A0ABV7CXV8_9BACI